MTHPTGDLLVLALAVWQTVEVWHHSSLCARPRDRLTAGAGPLSAVLGCPWCLSVWVALVLTAVVLVRPWGATLLWPLAASRLANLGNDLAHPRCRTPRADGLPRTPLPDLSEPPDAHDHDERHPADPFGTR